MRTQLRNLAQSVSGYTPIATEERSKVATSASLSDDFLLTLASSLEASPRLAAAAELTPEEIRDGIGFTNAYGPVSDDLLVHGRGLGDTVLTRRSDLCTRARRAYKIAQGFNAPKGSPPAIPNIDLLKEHFVASRRKKPAPTDPKTETPATQPELKKAA